MEHARLRGVEKFVAIGTICSFKSTANPYDGPSLADIDSSGLCSLSTSVKEHDRTKDRPTGED